METKSEMMLRISKEGHSFPHYDTCNTCSDDFHEVCKWERDRILKIINNFAGSCNLICWQITPSDFITKLKQEITPQLPKEMTKDEWLTEEVKKSKIAELTGGKDGN